MKHYNEKCENNLLENSLEKTDYNTALKEWFFHYEVIDNNEYLKNDDSRPSCELCEHEDLRWQFVIYNVHNNNQLKVGSSCIKKFDVALLDENGEKLYGNDRNKRINKLITLQRINSSNKITFEKMSELCRKKNMELNKLYMESWSQLKTEGTIEPKLALFLINSFIENNICFDDLDIKINSNKKYYEQINRMSKNAYMIIKPYLSKKLQECEKWNL